MTRENRTMTAKDLARSMGRSLVGRQVLTDRIGDYPGGIAQVVELHPDDAAPEIVFNVSHPTFGICGILADEAVQLIRQPVALEWEVHP